MNVTEAIYARKSIRAYKPELPDKKVIMEIFETAARTPSWANSQPWEVFIAAGGTLDRIRKGFLDNYKNAVQSVTDIPRPKEWTQAAKNRQMRLRPDMVRDCGEAADRFGELNQTMFYAPMVVYLCVDKLLSQWSLYDIGAYSQSVMLLAIERGISSIPAITSVAYPDVIRQELDIPENLNIAIGIPMGYADENDAINNFNSARSPLDETVRFQD